MTATGGRVMPRRDRRTTTADSKWERDDREELVGLAHDVAAHAETGPRLSGGDVDADWVGAYGSGEESVGGSVATPDQDIVDELGRALGVEQASDAPVRTSEEILRERDRFRWHLERKAADADEGRTRARRS